MILYLNILTFYYIQYEIGECVVYLNVINFSIFFQTERVKKKIYSYVLYSSSSLLFGFCVIFIYSIPLLCVHMMVNMNIIRRWKMFNIVLVRFDYFMYITYTFGFNFIFKLKPGNECTIWCSRWCCILFEMLEIWPRMNFHSIL